MTTTYSDKLRIALQGDGDNPTTWGQIANNSVFELIEDAISGYVNINISGNSNITLTTANGATDQARMAMIELSGNLIGNINLVVPTITKKYVIKTTYTGSFTVTVTTGSGSTVVLNSGVRTLLMCDGVNVEEVQPAGLGDLAYLDTITSAGLLSDTLFSGLATKTSVNTNDGLVLIDSEDGNRNKRIGVGNFLLAVPTIPVGTVLPFSSTTAPTGYLLCDGSAVSRTTYASLFAVVSTAFGVGDGSTTFNLPDLRGQFMRGWSTTSVQDPSGPRGVGNSQTDAFQGFSPVASFAFMTGLGNAAGETYYNAGGGTVPSQINWDATAGNPDSFTAEKGYVVSDGVNGTPRVSKETRPKNIAFTFIIKH